MDVSRKSLVKNIFNFQIITDLMMNVNDYEKVNYIHIVPYKTHFRELKWEYHSITQQKSRC